MKLKQIIIVFYFLISIFLSACGATQPATTPIGTPILSSASQTTTPSPTSTASPTVTPFNYQEFLSTESTRLMEMYGYASWDGLALKEVQEKIDPVKDAGVGWSFPGSPGLPFDEAIEKGLVADIVTVPVTTEYWKNLGVDKVVLLEMVFSDSKSPAMVATGFIMKDGKYEATLPIEVGPVESDWSQDVRLDSIASLQGYKGQLVAVKSVLYESYKLHSPDEVKASWAEFEKNWSHVHPVAIRHYDILSDRAQGLFEAAVANPDGYIVKAGLWDAIEKINEGGIPEYHLENKTRRWYAMMAWYLDWSDKEDAWIMGEVLSDDTSELGLRLR